MTQEDTTELLERLTRLLAEDPTLAARLAAITGDGDVVGDHNVATVNKLSAGDYAIQIGQLHLTLSPDQLRSLSVSASTSSPLPDTDMELRRLRAKLDYLCNLYQSSDCPFVLLGAVYLDIILYPIETTTLKPYEWSNLDSLRCKLGGSALLVGRYLGDLCRQRSYLFGAKGKEGDPFTSEFERLIAGERSRWMQDELVPCSSEGSCTGVTVHLIQQDRKFTTMFTDRGAVRNLDWALIAEKLRSRLTRGGVLYIGGYAKTALSTNLHDNLQALHENTLICIDHGRLTPAQARGSTMQSLRTVIELGLVDLYFCTYKELLTFYRRRGKDPSNSQEVKHTLEDLASRKALPPITAVRDDLLPGKTKAYVIVGRSVWPLGDGGGDYLGNSAAGPVVGPINAFNATMMYELVHTPRFGSLKDCATEAGEKAQECWAKLRSKAEKSGKTAQKPKSRAKLR